MDDDEDQNEVKMETEEGSEIDTAVEPKQEAEDTVTEIPQTVEVPVAEEKPAEVPSPAVPVTTPAKGRGGGRGRGGRGGVARRGTRR